MKQKQKIFKSQQIIFERNVVFKMIVEKKHF